MKKHVRSQKVINEHGWDDDIISNEDDSLLLPEENPMKIDKKQEKRN